MRLNDIFGVSDSETQKTQKFIEITEKIVG